MGKMIYYILLLFISFGLQKYAILICRIGTLLQGCCISETFELYDFTKGFRRKYDLEMYVASGPILMFPGPVKSLSSFISSIDELCTYAHNL